MSFRILFHLALAPVVSHSSKAPLFFAIIKVELKIKCYFLISILK